MGSSSVRPGKSSGSGIAPQTLAIASVASATASFIASRVWGAGTLLSAAATPVIVALVSEFLRRPAQRVAAVRSVPTGRERPVGAPAGSGRDTAPARTARRSSLSEARPERQARARRDACPMSELHFARGWRERLCPTCLAYPGKASLKPRGRSLARPHSARLRRTGGELTSSEACEELQRRGAGVATVPFAGRRRTGASFDPVRLDRLENVGSAKLR